MFDTVLIANRGAIACRIIRTLKRLGIQSVAVYSEADRHSLHVRQADHAVCIGPAPAAQSYLDQQKILEAARASGAQAIHPGYGFLSENAAFAEACEKNGIAFIGPTPQQMRDFGLKHTARELAQQNNVPLLPGSGLLNDIAQAHSEAARIGFPVMLKSTAGGGGIGMQLCWDTAQLEAAYHSVERLAFSSFGQGGIFLEKYVQRARHIEVQIFGDGAGNVVALGERDCSVQRRNQKVIEETPAPNLPDSTRAALAEAAVRMGRAVHYRSAGTVEFVVDADADPNLNQYYFLEVNTRLQVEHGVTEQITGVDLVEWMVCTAAGVAPDLADFVAVPRGHSIQVRLYAEDPNKHFQPSSGLLTEIAFPEMLRPETLRVDTWVETGLEVPPNYDPMLAKILSHGETRAEALTQLQNALDITRVQGIETNLDYLRQVLADAVFQQGRQYTRHLDSFIYQPTTVDVLQPGTQSTLQDWPGRIGYWDIGVPPSGPMDHLAFRLANRLVGNAEGTTALELTLNGPTLRFDTDTVIALTGAAMRAELDGAALDYWSAITVRAGQTLKLRAVSGAGMRAYLAVRGGFDAPLYMGSTATFTLGLFGGHGGRTLRGGDVLHLSRDNGTYDSDPSSRRRPGSSTTKNIDPGLRRDDRVNFSNSTDIDAVLPADLIPQYASYWDIGVLYGPHGAPDFFTADDIATFFATDWEVHYNSSRTGVRLLGPKPQWARRDGGEAGLHPSNIHDNAYAIGSIDFTGDMPVILGPDGPSLGGFVCPATIVQAELWKVGQLKPGDRVRFHCIAVEGANRLEQAQNQAIATLTGNTLSAAKSLVPGFIATPILAQQAEDDARVAVTYRQAGDKNILVEYGPLELDLNLRFRAHALMQWLQTAQLPGIADLTPGIRSLQVHYDSTVISQAALLDSLRAAEDQLPAITDMRVPSRIVHLPLSWDDPSTRLAIEKYMQSVRKDAPWCPSNIEFIRRINGLDSIEQVKDIVFNASYLVMGLGDVYLGAPVATPMDPRHRLVTTKYNPARTWTPENAVGIGGAYMCVYGMEGPGGYQFVGRTIQMWNRHHQTADFTEGKRWLLRFFDQIRFYPVSADELLQMREDFPLGKFQLRIEETELDLAAYNRFLAEDSASITTFKHQQQTAFDAERERWIASGQAHYSADPAGDAAGTDAGLAIAEGCIAIAASVTGSVWTVDVKVGERVNDGQTLIVVEAMKMEIAIESDAAGVVEEILCAPGSSVSAGQALIILRLDV